MIPFVLGVAVGFLPAVAACVVLDRRDEARRRVQERVDRMPAALPGAYGRDTSRALPGARTHTVVEEAPR